MRNACLTVLFAGLFALALPGCKSKGGASGDAAMSKKSEPSVVSAIAAAHGKAAYDTQDAVKADFDVDFGGGDLIAGTMWYTPSLGHVRMELDNGDVVVWDGDTAWATGTTPEGTPDYRFHVLTWPYFMAAPFKLGDPGTNLVDAGEKPLTDNAALPATKLTFDAGVGDAPDDWYLIFQNPDDGSLLALAYIVTYNTSRAYAEQKPSIVFYRNPTTVDSVTFAQQWVFHHWNAEAGIDGEPKGLATLSNIAFVTPPAGAFDKPDGAEEVALPGE